MQIVHVARLGGELLAVQAVHDEAIVTLHELPHQLGGRHYQLRGGHRRKSRDLPCNVVKRRPGTPPGCTCRVGTLEGGYPCVAQHALCTAQVGRLLLLVRLSMGAGSCLSSSSEMSAEDRISEVCDDGSTERLQEAVRILIQGLGEDVSREGLRDTPKVSSIASKSRPGASSFFSDK